MPPLNPCTRSCIALAIGQMMIPSAATAAVFMPATAAELVTAIVTSNSNSENDSINLNGNTITLTGVNNTPADGYGANGLPIILPDGNSSVTISNGAIVRGGGEPAFRILDIAPMSNVTLSVMTVSQGLADFGGGILNRGTLQVERSTISYNSASLSGGGILSFSAFGAATAALSMVNSTVTMNTADDGGGVYNYGASLTMLNTTVGDNSASDSGGGLLSVVGYGPSAGFLSLTNTLFGYNSANDGLDIHVRLSYLGSGRPASPANVALNNYVSEPQGANGIANGVNGNLVGVGNGKFPSPGGNGGETYTSPINLDSGARDSGNNTVCPAIDQRGALREDGLCDIGATESSPLQTSVTTLQDNPGGVVGNDVLGCSLREAVDSVANGVSRAGCIFTGGFDEGAEVTFDASLSRQTIQLNGQPIDINAPSESEIYVSARSVSGVTVDAQNLSHVIEVSGDTVTIDNLVMTNGSANSNGGGIQIINNADLTLQDSRVSNSYAPSRGGGVFVESSVLRLIDSTLSNNSALEYGGGLYAYNESSIDLNRSTVSNNTAAGAAPQDLARGGGISLDNSELYAVYSTIKNNRTSFSGGGIQGRNSSIDLIYSTVANNITDNLSGGGVYMIDGNLLTYSSTFSGNAASRGGAMMIRTFGQGGAPSLTLINSTVSGNSASENGSAIYAESGTVIALKSTTIANNTNERAFGAAVYTFGVLELTNSIIANTTGGADCSVSASTGSFDTDSNSIVEDGSCSVSSIDLEVSARAGDPGLEPLGNNGGTTRTHALRSNSIARNTANGGECEGADQRGKDRFENDVACDVGSVEFDAGDGTSFIVIPLPNGKVVVVPN